MEILKPQSPLYHKKEDSYFYPLTTEDQVILDNGSRLNSINMLTIDTSNSPLEEGVPSSIDADTLGGYKPEDFVRNPDGMLSVNLDEYVEGEYVLANADKLGDMPAEAYAQKEYVNNEITNRIIYGKGKNLFNIKEIALSSDVGLTVTVNNDGSVTMKGTTSNYYQKYKEINLEPGTYKVCSVGADNSATFQVRIVEPGETSTTIYEHGAVFTITSTETTVYAFIYAGINRTIDTTIYPMICLASETDNTYEPYYEGLKSLTDRGMELLWENANPTSEFTAQVVNVDMKEYDAIAIFISYHASGGGKLHIFKKNMNDFVHFVFTGENQWRLASRRIYIYEESIAFDGAYQGSSTATDVYNRNAYLVPLKIYGIKGVM